MRFKVIALEAFAIFVSYLVFSLTLVAATDVNIMYNGQVQDTAKYEHDKLVNMNILINHDPSDITWTNVKLATNLNSASLSHSIKKILLYKCLSSTPTECVRSTPQSFDNYVDTELLWNDISERTSPAQYPQAGNLLFLVKLEDTNSKESWAGFFVQVKRTSYNIFDVRQLSLNSMDVYAKSLDLVQPIKSYIENKFMVPFNWATKVVFTNANPLYGLGANKQEMESHSLQTAVVSVNEITSINKDFYFVAPNISSGIASPITLNLNPSFSCGNGACESDIGESMGSCCYDCGCPTGQFCDTPANINLSSCRNDTSSISIISASTPTITDCSKGFNANISIRINNPQASLESRIQGTANLNNTVYSTQCTGSSGSYVCPVLITSQIKCGGGSYVIGPGLLNLTLNYKDGPNSASKALSASFSGVSVSYDCGCQEGSYCDTAKKSCQSESAITLGITRLTSYLENYHQGDRINLTAKIFNPPAGTVLVDKSATMNLTNGQVSPGTPDCSSPNSQYEYNCLIPFQIVNYQNTNAYTFNPNTLSFVISYNDGPLAKTKTISAPFGPVSIPSRTCGDGQCNMDETQDTCCLDCGCATGYCDKVNGCRDPSSVTLSISSANPTNFTDCRQSHTVYLGVAVNNAPTDLVLDHQSYLQAGLDKGWNLQCQKLGLNLFNCTLIVPPLEAEGCSLPYKLITQNSINMSISFPDGKSKQIIRTLSAPFSDIFVIPVYHCGDGTCESSIGENPSVCCYDCSCKTNSSFGNDYYCDFDQENSFLGSCLPKSNITLVIDSPRVPVSLSSCEITSDINIKAHIQNQPKNARPESYYAIVNGTAAEMIACNPQQAYQGANLTFNCSLMLPRIYQCTQGGTYTFEPNSMSMLLSFENGRQTTEVQTLTASLPTITIRQGIRTLYDIIQEGIAKLRGKLRDTISTAHALLDEIKSCMETVKTLAYLTLILTIAGAVYGGSQKDSISTPVQTPTGTITSTRFSNAVAGANLGNLIGNNLMQAYTKMCDYLQSIYTIDLKVQEMEIRMIQMEMCTEMNQHMLDIGRCDGQEQSCFSSMVSCVNLGDLSSLSQSLSTMVSNSNSKLTGMTTILGSTVTTIGGVAGGGYGGYYSDIWVSCGGEQKNSCCSMKPQTAYGGSTQCIQQEARLRLQYSDCKYPAVAKKIEGSSTFTWFCVGGSCDNQIIEPPSIDKVDVRFRYYCFPDQSIAMTVGVTPGRTVNEDNVKAYCPRGDCGSVEKIFTYERYAGGANCQCPSQSQTSGNLQITNVLQRVQGNLVTITWTTNLPANSEVAYGILSTDEKRKRDSPYVTSHSMDLSVDRGEIQCGRSYAFTVMSATQAGASQEFAGNPFYIAC